MYSFSYIMDAGRKCTAVLMCLFCVLLAKAGISDADMLVADGKKVHYVAVQEEGAVFTVYPDGEWVRFADGFGYINGLAVCPDGSVYVLSRSRRQLFLLSSGGRILMTRDIAVVPQAVFVDRDGGLHLLRRTGPVAEN